MDGFIKKWNQDSATYKIHDFIVQHIDYFKNLKNGVFYEDNINAHDSPGGCRSIQCVKITRNIRHNELDLKVYEDVDGSHCTEGGSKCRYTRHEMFEVSFDPNNMILFKDDWVYTNDVLRLLKKVVK